MRARQKVSRAGVELIKSFEGLRSTAARLPDGRWTLGYGHTFSAREGARVTQEDADALLRFDLLPIVDALNNAVLVPLNQNQFDALVSFCFNIGVENFAHSTVLKRINEGRMTEAAQAMDAWRSAEFNGQTYVLAPLIRRRAAEKNLFLTPDETTGNAPTLLVRPVEDASDQSMRPSELDAPDRGGILSAFPVGTPEPVRPEPVNVTPPPAPAKPDPVLASYYSPYAQPVPATFSPPAPEPVAFAPRIVEALPENVTPSAVREAPIVEAVPTAFAPLEDGEPQMSPAVQAALARAQEEQRQRDEAAAVARAAEEARILDLQRQEFARLEQARLEQARLEHARLEQARLEHERIERERQAAEAERLRQEEFARARVAAEQARLDYERQERERQDREHAAADAERQRIEQERLERERQDRELAAAEAERQRVAAEQARLEQEQRDRTAAEAERARVEQERLDRERQAVAAAQAEQGRLDQERRNRELAAAEAEREKAAIAARQTSGEEAEKIRKAEAAAALMRLYSPYGGGALGKPLAGPLVKPVAPAPAPAPAEEFTNQSVIAPQAAQSSPIEISSQPMSTRPAPPAEPEDAEEEDESSALVMPTVPGVAASAQPAPVITAFNSPYARPIPRPELTKVEPVPAPEIVEVPRPVAVDLSAPSASKIFENPQAAPNWREQLQRPLPEGYAAPEVVQPEQQASLVQNGRASRYEQMYEDDNEAWTIDGDRIALSSEEMHEEGASWGKMIISTLWWIFFSAIGLAALGVAAAAYFKSKDPSVLRIGAFDDYMKVSVISAAIGIFFVSVSVWLIMKRLGGLKD